jgi:gliding motility-associated-like protein
MRLLIIHLFCSFVFWANGQYHSLDWVKQVGGAGNEEGYSIGNDAQGNTYITGIFTSTTDFDPGPGVFMLTPSGGETPAFGDIFILKLNADGEFVWAKQMGSTSSVLKLKILLDAAGDIYLSGEFSFSIDADPGPGTFYLEVAEQGEPDIFFCKLNNNGELTWAKQISVKTSQEVVDIALHPQNGLFVSGNFTGTVDFDPGPGEFSLTTPNDISHAFIANYNPSGELKWVKQFGGAAISGAYLHISTDPTGNIIASGNFFGEIDADPGAGFFLLNNVAPTYTAAFVLKLNASGNLLWAKQLAGNNSDPNQYIHANAHSADKDGNVLIAGNFNYTPIDIDPGPGVFNLTSTRGQSDIFICKLDASGNFISGQSIGGPGQDNIIAKYGIQSDASGNSIIAGYFSQSFVFNEPQCDFRLAGRNARDFFMAKLDAAGKITWSKMIGGGYGQLFGNAFSLDATGSIFLTGRFNSIVDFDPSPFITRNLYSNASGASTFDAFVLKLSPCINTKDTTIFLTSCEPITINCQTFSETGVYTMESAIPWGCYNKVTMNFTRSQTVLSPFVDSATTCNSYDWLGKTYSLPGLYYDTVASTNGCDTVRRLHLAFSNVAVRDSHYIYACRRYFYKSNWYYQSGIYYDTLRSNTSCDTIFTLNLEIDNPIIFPTVATSCNSFSWRGKNFTQSGLYADSILGPRCIDTLYTLELTILPSPMLVDSVEICEGLQYEGYRASGTYTRTLIAANGCDSIITLVLTVNSLPRPNLGIDTVICNGIMIDLNPGIFDSYRWQDGSINGNFRVVRPGTYAVAVTNECGTSTDEIIISEGVCTNMFPTAFTPNNDGLNDVFKVLGGYGLQQFYLVIFNRWGQKVFETNDYTKGWDGTLNGKKQPAGLYSWRCRLKKEDEDVLEEKKGVVTLIR